MASYLTQQDLDNFGPELIDVAQRAAHHAMGPELQRLHDENEQLRDEVSRAAKTSIDQYLDANVSNWREINNDPRFHSWLLQPEPYSGVVRDRLLKDAAHSANAPRVASFFKVSLLQKESLAQLLPERPREELPDRHPANAFIAVMKLRGCGACVVRAKLMTRLGGRWEYELCVGRQHLSDRMS